MSVCRDAALTARDGSPRVTIRVEVAPPKRNRREWAGLILSHWFTRLVVGAAVKEAVEAGFGWISARLRRGAKHHAAAYTSPST